METDVRSKSSQRELLWGRVVRWTGNPLLVQFTARLLRIMGVRERDEMGLARAVQVFSQKWIKYFREHPERWVSPLRTILWRIGDCDDKSILIATILRSFRIPVRLVFLRFEVGGKRFAHVYPRAYLQGKWRALESVRPYPLGMDPAEMAKLRGYRTTVEEIGDEPGRMRDAA